MEAIALRIHPPLVTVFFFRSQRREGTILVRATAPTLLPVIGSDLLWMRSYSMPALDVCNYGFGRRSSKILFRERGCLNPTPILLCSFIVVPLLISSSRGYRAAIRAIQAERIHDGPLPVC